MPAPPGPARRPVRTFLLAAILLLSAGAAASTHAEETLGEPAPSERPFEPPGEPAGSERPVGPAEETPPLEGLIESGMGAAGRAMDATHASIEQSILDRVIWFDEFFGRVRAEETRPPEYLLRLTQAARFEEGGEVLSRTAIRANLRLPKIGRRLRLVVAGESDVDPAARLPEDPGTPAVDRTTPSTRLRNAEIQYWVLQRPSANLFLGAGFRLRIPPEAFVRTRLQYTHRLSAVSLVRFGETLFLRDPDGFGQTTEVDLERVFGPKTLLRWANAGTVSQKSEGLEWATELSLQRQLTPGSAVTLAGAANGDTRPSAQAEIYRIFTRYRRNVLRPWLFLEFEPEIFWRRNDGGGHPAALAFTFRVEVLFQGKGVAGEARKPDGS